MSPAPLSTQALSLAWAAQVGAVTWEEVIAWADGWILGLNTPPDEVLELSLASRLPGEAWTLLRQLARGGDPATAVPLLVRRLLDAVREEKLEASSLAEHLDTLRLLSSPGVPDDVRLPDLPDEFLEAAHHLWFLSEPWNLDFSPDVRAEVVAMLESFL